MMQTSNYKVTTQIHRTNEILENWMVGVGELNALIENSAISRKIEKRVVTRFETCLTMRSYGINIIVILVITRNLGDYIPENNDIRIFDRWCLLEK